MLTLPPYHRLLLLAEGQLGVFTSKTAAALLRYRASDVVAIVDSHVAGRPLTDFIAWGGDQPIVPDIAAAESLRPDGLVIGVTPVGGQLPEPMRRHVVAALEAGIDVISGLHSFLAEDAELVALAGRRGARIIDTRRPPEERVIATARALGTAGRRVLTVGTDANVGKMVAALELTATARSRRLDARFLATGQTGIIIAGCGVAVDACVADFAAGAVEDLVLSADPCDVCLVEGQGSLGHPGFSAVTLALLHGALPDALVLVHRMGRDNYKAPPHSPLPAFERLIAAYEATAALLHPAQVVAVALNSVGFTDAEVAAERERLERQLQLPVADPIRDGCDTLLDAVLA
jgi:uncharacterized NAD-dependent epimerase/dehydratase family protein